jgi:hypothetical protein
VEGLVVVLTALQLKKIEKTVVEAFVEDSGISVC